MKPTRRSESALDRFLRYVKIDTQSAEDMPQVPSTSKQLDLARLLLKELKAMGVKRATLDAHGYVMATIPANLPKDHQAHGKVPRVGLIAHLDTSPSASGAGVKPQVFTYRGGDIRLPGNPEVVIRTRENPELKGQVGKLIVTSDAYGGKVDYRGHVIGSSIKACFYLAAASRRAAVCPRSHS